MTKEEIIKKYQNKKLDMTKELLSKINKSNMEHTKIFSEFMNQVLDCVISDLEKLNSSEKPETLVKGNKC